MPAGFGQRSAISGQGKDGWEGETGRREGIPVGGAAQGGGRSPDPTVMLDPNPNPWVMQP